MFLHLIFRLKRAAGAVTTMREIVLFANADEALDYPR
jgi:hypothetical protein